MSNASGHNPALRPIEVLAGEWEMHLSNAAFLSDPTSVIRGMVSFDWVQDGAFLRMQMGQKPSGGSAAIWLIGRDETSANYTVLYYDDRSVSRAYSMSFEAGLWKMWRNAPGFYQRYEGKVSDDARTITAYWEKSTDGSEWEHDFDVKYTKLLRPK